MKLDGSKFKQFLVLIMLTFWYKNELSMISVMFFISIVIQANRKKSYKKMIFLYDSNISKLIKKKSVLLLSKFKINSAARRANHRVVKIVCVLIENLWKNMCKLYEIVASSLFESKGGDKRKLLSVGGVCYLRKRCGVASSRSRVVYSGWGGATP